MGFYGLAASNIRTGLADKTAAEHHRISADFPKAADGQRSWYCVIIRETNLGPTDDTPFTHQVTTSSQMSSVNCMTAHTCLAASGQQGVFWKTVHKSMQPHPKLLSVKMISENET